MFTRTALQIAFRELRASGTRFLFAIAAVAVGVAALSGIKGFGSAFRSALLHNAKQLIAADVQAQVWNDPTPQQLTAVSQIGAANGGMTRVTETISMAGSPKQRFPQLISVKAVDPSAYPYYGTLSLHPSRPLNALLPDDHSVVVTAELLVRLKVKLGDRIRLGGKDFTITGSLLGEPDRLASGFGPSMRALITRDGLTRTGLVTFGSRAAQRFLFKLKPGVDLEDLKTQLKSAFPRVFISDYREGSPVVGDAIARTTTFLSLISLIALIVGSLGVGMAIHSHIQQRMENIGIMKALGGRGNQILQIYLFQSLCLGIAGALLGVLAGLVVQKVFPVILQRVFAQLPEVAPDWSFTLEGVSLGILSALLFTVPALLEVQGIRPNLIFRREMSEDSADGRAAWRPRTQTVVAGAIILLGFVGVATWVSQSLRMGLYFTLGIVVSIVVLFGVAAALLVLLRRSIRLLQDSVPPALRHGIANLYRPGNQARAVLVALGIGVMFTLTTYLLQKTVLLGILRDAPTREGNLLLLDIRDPSSLSNLLSQQPGVESRLELVGYIVARMLSQNGIPISQISLPRRRKDQAEAVRITTATSLPSNLHLKQGHWWQPNADGPVLAISEESRNDFHLKLGDVLRFQAAGRILEAPVVAVFERDARGPVRYDLVFPRNSLKGLPVVFYGSVHADPNRIPDIEETLFERFPTVTVMNIADVLKRVEEAVDQISLVIRFLTMFAVIAGVIVLSSSVASTRYRRIREIAILKTLGATKRRIRTIYALEFSVLGAISGAVGALLANFFTKVIASKFIEISFSFDLPSILFAMLGTAVLANVAGWLASARLLQQKPLQVLRAE